MSDLRSERTALVPALFIVAALGLAACSGGGASVGPNPVASSGGAVVGGATASPVAGATASPVAGATASGAPSSAAPTAGPSTAPGSGGGATAAPTPTAVATGATTPSSIDSISILPAVVDGDLGGVAQIGILDPNYTGAYNVTVTGGGLLLNALQTLSNVINGTLTGTGGETTLTLNLADAVQLGLLGPNGDVVQICEQQNPTTCKSVSITNNGVVPQVGASLDSIVFGPNSTQTLTLVGPTLQALSGFTVSAAPQGISVTNLGNGQFEIGAAANVAVPLTGSVTFTNGTQTITIPLSVL